MTPNQEMQLHGWASHAAGDRRLFAREGLSEQESCEPETAIRNYVPLPKNFGQNGDGRCHRLEMARRIIRRITIVGPSTTAHGVTSLG